TINNSDTLLVYCDFLLEASEFILQYIVMQMFIIFVLLSVAVCLLMLVFSGKLTFGSKKRKKRAKQGAQSKKYADGINPGCCPLCGTFLIGKEKIKSSVFEGGKASDRLCYIHGCPHCLPPESPEIRRVCPVCRKTVPLDGHLTARMFERKGGAHHVHILGCTECHKR
ncbi:MAG: hypothetical protein K6E21_03875, partial [Bacilli bacterium]|nr:hypothetical protein [Bacilli bacterium]